MRCEYLYLYEYEYQYVYEYEYEARYEARYCTVVYQTAPYGTVRAVRFVLYVLGFSAVTWTADKSRKERSMEENK